ncbi:MAG: hypothetical protein HGA44_14205, partial [Cellulomonadaceae bacterium]|nr:hypothetical protein [Cellulomonadaceae bacterium]
EALPEALHDDVPHGSATGPTAPLVLALGATAVVGFLAVPVGVVLARAAAVVGG